MKNITKREIFINTINLFVGMAVYNKYDLKAAILTGSVMTLISPLHNLSKGISYNKTKNWDNLKKRLWGDANLKSLKEKYSYNLVTRIVFRGYDILTYALYTALTHYVIDTYLRKICLDYTKILVNNHNLAQIAATALVYTYILENLGTCNEVSYKHSVSYICQYTLRTCIVDSQLNSPCLNGLKLLNHIIFAWFRDQIPTVKDSNGNKHNDYIGFLIGITIPIISNELSNIYFNNYINLERTSFARYFVKAGLNLCFRIGFDGLSDQLLPKQQVELN